MRQSDGADRSFAVVRASAEAASSAESRGRAGGEDLQPPGADRNWVLHARRARGARCRRDRAQARLRNALEELASVIAGATRLGWRCARRSPSARRRWRGAARGDRGARRARRGESLERGKRLLQETMAGQLEAVRAQLGRQREQNGALGGGAAARRRPAAARDGANGGDRKTGKGFGVGTMYW